MKNNTKKFICFLGIIGIMFSVFCLSVSAYSTEPREDGYRYMKEGNYNGWSYEVWVDSSVRLEAEISSENSYAILISYDNVTNVIDEWKPVTTPSEISGSPVKYIENRNNSAYFSQHWYFKELTIADGVEFIGDKALTDAHFLEKITIPGTVKQIGSRAFDSNDHLTEVVLNEGIEIIGEYAFFDTPLKSVKLPESIKNIGDNAFAYSDINSVEISGENIAFGWRVFQGCDKLTSVKAEKFSGIIGNTVFEKTPFKDNAKGLLCVGNTLLSYIGAGESEITIPEGIKTINDDAFFNCKDVKTINFPKSLKEIGSDSFRGCQNLTSIVLPENVTRVGGGAFYECTALKTIVLNEGLEVIGSSAFENCIALEEIKIPDSVTLINERAFKYCKNLKTVTLGANVNIIGNEAFMDCFSLSSVNFNDNLMQIGEKAFYGCALEDVTILRDDIEIGNMAIGYAYDATAGTYSVYEKCVITANRDSNASQYANNYGITFNENEVEETDNEDDSLVDSSDKEIDENTDDTDDNNYLYVIVIVGIIVIVAVLVAFVYKKKSNKKQKNKE